MNPRIAELMYTASVDLLNRQPGPGVNYVGNWWLVDAAEQLMFYHRHYHYHYTAQCNADRATVEHLYPGLDVVQVPHVFVPNRFRPCVLTPYVELPGS